MEISTQIISSIFGYILGFAPLCTLIYNRRNDYDEINKKLLNKEFNLGKGTKHKFKDILNKTSRYFYIYFYLGRPGNIAYFIFWLYAIILTIYYHFTIIKYTSFHDILLVGISCMIIIWILAMGLMTGYKRFFEEFNQD